MIIISPKLKSLLICPYNSVGKLNEIKSDAKKEGLPLFADNTIINLKKAKCSGHLLFSLPMIIFLFLKVLH
jgi:hypothetical protein